MSSVLVILNPTSCGGKGATVERRLRSALEERGITHRYHRTEAPGHAAELARSARDEEGLRILVVGGDGTLHEVANGLLKEGGGPCGPAVALLPMGTGNDFFRMVGVDGGVARTLDLLVRGRRSPFDVGVARWDDETRYFVNLLGVGVDVEVLARRERFRRLPGLLQYLAALTTALVRFRPILLRIEVVGAPGGAPEVIEGPSLLSAVTVGPTVGGGIRVCPGASPHDGFLDLCFVGAMSPLSIVRTLPKAIRGRHGQTREVVLRRFKQLRIEAGDGGPLSFEMDGELVSHRPASIEVGIEEGALGVLLPPEGAEEEVR